MSEANSPFFKNGLADGAADALRNPRERRGFRPEYLNSWMYRRGFARGFLAVRRMTQTEVAAMLAGLEDAWDALEAAGWKIPAAAEQARVADR